MQGAQGFLLQARHEGVRPDFMLYVGQEKREEKLHGDKRSTRMVGHVLQSCRISSDGRLFALSSRVLIDSVSQITSPLKCDYNIPPAITIIT